MGKRSCRATSARESVSRCMELLLPGGTFDRIKQRCPYSYHTALHRVSVCVCVACIPVSSRLVCKHTHTVARHPPRCSGDFSQCKQTKYNMSLPGLPERVIAQQLASDLNDMEKTVAAAPGMYGRIWYGQGPAFDEAYQIRQDRHTCNCLYTHIGVASAHVCICVCVCHLGLYPHPMLLSISSNIIQCMHLHM